MPNPALIVGDIAKGSDLTDRNIIPSPKYTTKKIQPEMSRAFSTGVNEPIFLSRPIVFYCILIVIGRT